MKKQLIAAFAFMFIVSTFMLRVQAQTSTNASTVAIVSKSAGEAVKKDSIIHDDNEAVVLKAVPVGGHSNFRKLVEKKFKFPKAATKARAEGELYATFVISRTGELTHIKVEKHVGHGTEEAYLNALRAAAEEIQWEPGTIGGRAVDMMFSHRIRVTSN
ncbi:energy transducer TonB [Sphingobacterium sp. HJSM2_6]|uniref:energy transducer TonB n=1 Tax=Sphingobacterium sp. HJSM2_6 TaxID=3366264 RepID=UPI003BE58EC8